MPVSRDPSPHSAGEPGTRLPPARWPSASLPRMARCRPVGRMSLICGLGLCDVAQRSLLRGPGHGWSDPGAAVFGRGRRKQPIERWRPVLPPGGTFPGEAMRRGQPASTGNDDIQGKSSQRKCNVPAPKGYAKASPCCRVWSASRSQGGPPRQPVVCECPWEADSHPPGGGAILQGRQGALAASGMRGL